MKLTDLHEGIFDRFRKKPEPQMLPLTQEQRNLIQHYFRSTNAGLRFGGEDSKYVLELNAHANHGRGRISFRNEDGVLKASVGYHGSERDALDPKTSPIGHYDVTVNSPADMQKLVQELT